MDEEVNLLLRNLEITQRRLLFNSLLLPQVPQKIRTCCQECGHKHRENVYCHCYTEADTDEDPNDGIFDVSREFSENLIIY